MSKHWKLFPALTILAWMLGSSASGARFPNSLPKTVTVEGERAQAWLKTLGLNPGPPQQLSLPLHDMEVHARKIRVGGESATPLNNQISWEPKTQTLTLSGDWLDQKTGSSRELSRFTFGSGFIAPDLGNAGGWEELLKARGLPRSEDQNKKIGEILDKRVSGWLSPKLSVLVYRAQSYDKDPKGSWGYQIVIGVDEK